MTHLLHSAGHGVTSVLALGQNLGADEFTSAAQNPIRDPKKSYFWGTQVRIPMSEVKNYIAERVKF